MNEDLKYLLALTSIKNIGSIRARLLINTFGSAKAVFDADPKELKSLARIGESILEQRNNPILFEKAEREIHFVQDHHIKTYIYGQEGYPTRLLECPDAPALLFFLGNTNLNSQHTLSIVGTRNATQYGRDMVSQFVSQIRSAIPDLVIFSGLALGIDITAHRAALENDIPTVGVVAHGLDRIYPSAHRNDASHMIERGGGILTEYLTGTEPERGNFIARNRIIAGLSDAIIVAESKDKGGSLVTAAIGTDYNREVFAFPGRSTDDRSRGCNRLIRLNRAGLITNAQDFLESVGWNTPNAQIAIQQSIPFEEDNLSPIGRQIIDSIRDRGDLRLSQLTDLLGIEHSTLLEELLDLEMEGKIRNTPGGLYQLK